MLFRADLHHVSYTVAPVLDSPVKSVDDGILRGISLTSVALDTEAIETTTIQPKALKTAVRADAETEDERRGVVQLEKFDSTLYFLDKREIEYLRTAIDAEYSQDHTLGVLALLFDILQAQSDSDVRDEVIGVLENLLPYLLGTGRFGSVAYLTGELRKITRATKFEPAHKAALDELRVSVSEVATLTQLFHVLDQAAERQHRRLWSDRGVGSSRRPARGTSGFSPIRRKCPGRTSTGRKLAPGFTENHPQAQEWVSFLAGSKLTTMSSYSSGSAGGYSARTDIYLCSDRSFVMREESSVSVDVGGAFGSSGGTGNGRGRWYVITNGQVVGLVLEFDNGETQEFRMEYENEQTYANGERVFVTPAEVCM
jgi:hypothetical protein